MRAKELRTKFPTLVSTKQFALCQESSRLAAGPFGLDCGGCAYTAAAITARGGACRARLLARKTVKSE
jgi:hypothetical protein